MAKKYMDGTILKINLSENRIVFGRLLPNRIGIYDLVLYQTAPIPSVQEIIAHSIFLYCSVFKDVVTNGTFEMIGFQELVHEDITKIPPKFVQDIVNLNDCVIFWTDGRELKVAPEDCIGLEPSSAWDSKGLIARIEDHYAGRKNPHVELGKVILTNDDPRYLNPKARWDFSMEKWVRE